MSNERLEGDVFKRGPGGRPTRQEAERRHQSLLATTFRLFLEKGWEAASIDEISRQSGVAKTFIYARYPNKVALFVGAILKLTFYVKCAACSGRLGQFAMTTMGPFGRRMNYCPYCGISLDRAAPSPDGSDLK